MTRLKFIIHLFSTVIFSVSSWGPSTHFVNYEARGLSKTGRISTIDASFTRLSATEISEPFPEASTENQVFVRAIASAGVSDSELEQIIKIIEIAYQNYVGVHVPVDLEICLKNMISRSKIAEVIPGAMGRVLLLKTNIDDDSIEMIEYAIAEQMDQLLYSEPPAMAQPVLISLQNSLPDALVTTLSEGSKYDQASEILSEAVSLPLEVYGIKESLNAGSSESEGDNQVYLPSFNVELDSAQTEFGFDSETFWDTSSVLVFDDLVDTDLRRRLLDTMLGRRSDDGKDNDAWDDMSDGPNPDRWIRGGLSDTPDDVEAEEADNTDGTCWGLPEAAIEELCFQKHDAIEEFEAILAKLFPHFDVTRLPEAVFGSYVSPLTANAPTAGDYFDYHIDGDPNLTPPSPWTDVYGRYPNRVRGKPRFMSCLIYLNDEWDGEKWGAPTRFLDPPTNEYYEVLPKPGRCVIMDQDCRHTVVAPNSSAGKRPRYSLVWKLILHPKKDGQDMTDLAGSREWPEPVLFGSAKQPNAGDINE